jgi:hypothetical protein
MRYYRLVLLLLAAPLIGVSVVLWFFLPGSVAGITYTPSQFNRQAQLQPLYWPAHSVTITGYIRSVPCRHGACTTMVLSDTPLGSWASDTPPDPTRDIILLPQRESKWHSVLRHILPQVVAAPLTATGGSRRVTITGSLRAGFSPGEVPALQPVTL